MRKKKLDWAVVTPSSILLRGTKEYNFLENTTKRIEAAKRGTKEKLLMGMHTSTGETHFSWMVKINQGNEIEPRTSKISTI
jgi:hypothetical protein